MGQPVDAKRPDGVFITPADNVVLEELLLDIDQSRTTGCHESPEGSQTSRDFLAGMNDPKHSDFQPTVFCGWDYDLNDLKISNAFYAPFLRRYITWARSVVRHETDVVFLSHIILYFCTSVPSALYLCYNFHYLHGVVHILYTAWSFGPFTLMLHNHIHNNGVLSKQYATFDLVFPYILEPLMGHTWDSYYHHHIKAHHVESNGPDDPSSTLRYQRDSIRGFLHYEFRFLLLCWFDLPVYFARRRKYRMAFRVMFTELASYAFMYFMARWNFKPVLFVLILPFAILRLGLMIGNWGQHALVDEVSPSSDFRSSITLIDVPSNRFCFNDGYHTSHHLNPRRHWRDHPGAFLKAKQLYSSEGALVFYDIDYLGMTYRLLRKDYKYLAEHLVPIGEQTRMSTLELAAMLQTKTKKFSEEEIRSKFKIRG